MTIDIRPLTTYHEIDQLVALQQSLWAWAEREVIPGHLLLALQKQGAALLGAVDRVEGVEHVVGFVLSVLGTVEKLNQRIDPIAAARLKMFTVALGVRADYRGQDAGFRLKRAERAFAMRIGVRLITSTFDPLDAYCARLHIGRLGAISHQYWRSFAGETTDENGELAGDRLHAEWWITSHRAEGRTNEKRRPLSFDQLIGGGARLINPSTVDGNGRPQPSDKIDTLESSLKLVEIPPDYAALRATAPALGARWRLHLRDVLETLFLDQYMITDFVEQTADDGRNRTFYMLAQRSV